MSKTDATHDHNPSHPSMISVEQALSFLLQRARTVAETEQVAIVQARGRVVAEALVSNADVPSFDHSAMDGIAVRSDDTGVPRVTLRIAQRIAAGDSGVVLSPGEAARIFTGAPLPPGADAIVMQEDCVFDGDQVTFDGPVPASQHVRPRGNNIKQGMELLPTGIRIRPQEQGIAVAAGFDAIRVYRRLRVAFFSSGDELVEPGEALQAGQIYNSNRYALRGLLEGLGCEALDLGIVRDDLAATEALLCDAAREADVVITSGGVSVGEEDHVKAAISAVGDLELWSIAVRPGKPVAFGTIGEADFFGLPGNPVSTLVTFCLFARPFLLRRQGVRDVAPTRVPVRADFDWPTPMRRREFLRARLSVTDDGVLHAAIYPKQGSDVLSSTVWASGLVEIPEHTTVRCGEQVSYLGFEQLLG